MQQLYSSSDNDFYSFFKKVPFKKLGMLILVLTLLTQSNSFAQFTEITPDIDSVYNSSVDWGDYDRDGDLDILLSGKDTSQTDTIITRIYENTGSGNFNDINAGLTGVYAGQVEWWDYNNDNYPDIILAGISDNNYVVQLYKNDQTGGFIPVSVTFNSTDSTILAPFDIGDYNNYGKLDIVFNGQGSTTLYRNSGNGNFVVTNSALTDDVSYGDIKFGDYDNDGDLDLLTAEGTEFNNQIFLYENKGDGNFQQSVDLTYHTTPHGASYPQKIYDVEWNDFNNDGRLDILLSYIYDGSTLGFPVQILLNEGDVSFRGHWIEDEFTDITAELVKSGDFNNDGNVDVFVTGTDGIYSEPLHIPRLYKNNGDTTFTEVGPAIDSVNNGAMEWGDYDNDQDLDMLLSGISQDGTPVTKIYRNETGSSNNIPSTPANLKSKSTAGKVTLSWSPSSDAESTAKGVSYNLWVSPVSSPADTFVVSPMANDTMSSGQHGKRYVVDHGNAGRDTSWNLFRLPAGTYYWSVQAIDGAYEGSPFAAEDTFTVPQKDFKDTLNTNFIQVSGDVSWVDYDRDNDLDVLITGKDTTVLYENNGSGSFTGTTFPQLGADEYVSWADVDEDGDLDFIIENYLYINEEGSYSQNYISTQGYKYEWGDFDNDGDLDLFSYGDNGAGLYRNNGNNEFSDWIWEESFISIKTADFGDYDNDGDLDIIYAHANDVKLFENQNGDPVDKGSILNISGNSYIEWGDYNNDGYLDILFMDYDDKTGVLKNNGNGTFTEVVLSDRGYGSGNNPVRWIDIDNDSDLDILITDGNNEPGTPSTRLYHNKGNDNFEYSLLGIPSLEYSSIAVGDAEKDGDLDILLSGKDTSGNEFAEIYENKTTVSNTVPSAPTNPVVNYIESDSIELSWSAASDNETPTDGLRYNVRMGTSIDSVDTRSPMADTGTGFRYIVDEGAIAEEKTYLVLNPDSIYYWQVQAVDAAYAGGEFSAIDSFSVNSPPQIDIPSRFKSIDVNESGNYYYPYGDIYEIEISDTDIGSNSLQVSLSVDTGRLSLSSVDNLQFDYGDGMKDDSMSYRGTLSQVNESLDSLEYLAPDTFALYERDTLRIRVNDQGYSGIGPAREDLAISDIYLNRMPYVDEPIPDQTLKEDTGYVFVANLDSVFSDPEGRELDYNIVKSLKLDYILSNDSLEIKPHQDEFGMDSLIIRAYNILDYNTEWAYDTVLVQILPVNDTPKIIVPDTVFIAEDNKYEQGLSAWVDDGNDDHDLDWEAEFPEPFSDTNYTLTIDSQNTISIEPIHNYNGSDLMQLRVTDTSGITDTAFTIVDVTPVNDPPYFVNFPDTVTLHCDKPIDTVNLYDITEDPELPDTALIYDRGSHGSGFNSRIDSNLFILEGNMDPVNTGSYSVVIGVKDSVHNYVTKTMTVVVQGPTENTIHVDTCDSYTVPSGDETWAFSGTYRDTIPNQFGCDSILTIDLTITTTTITVNESACDSFTVPSGDETYYNSGTYQDTLQTETGCDSIITFNLTVTQIDTSVRQSGAVLTSNASLANSYQWLDCDDGYSEISGETSATFEASSNGSYSVMITKGNCTDTSNCHTVTSIDDGDDDDQTGIVENTFDHSISMFPNPTTGKLLIEMGATHRELNVRVSDLSGGVVQKQTFSNTGQFELNIDEQPGIYIIRIWDNDGKQAIMKVLKE